MIAHNMRSTHNVGSLLRTAEGLGVKRVFLTGYTPYPTSGEDRRLPHIAVKINNQIAKTALGAEKMIQWRHSDAIEPIIEQLQDDDFTVVALEQTTDSTSLLEFKPPQKVALVLGREVEGIEPEVLNKCDQTVEIPMQGDKESFNVVQAAAMALYHITYMR